MIKLIIFLFLNLFLVSAIFADTFKVGVLVPTTGIVAGMGQAVTNGIKLYQKSNPADSVEFIFEDHEYDGTKTVTAYRKLKNIDQVDQIIIWGNTPTQVLSPIVAKDKIPVFAITHEPHGYQRENIITFGPRTKPLMELMKRFLDKSEYQNTAIVTVDIGSAIVALEYLNSLYPETKKLLFEKIAPDSSDFKALISKLKHKQVDSVFLFALNNQTLTFAKQANAMDFKPAVIGADVAADTAFQKTFKQFLPEIYYTYAAVEDQFRQELIAEYGDDSYFLEAAGGYYLAKLLTEMAKSSADLVKATENVSPYPFPEVKADNLVDYGMHLDVPVKVYP